MLYYILICICIEFLYIGVSLTTHYKTSLILRVLSSLSFMLLGLYFSINNKNALSLLTYFGLVCGVSGDICNGLRNLSKNKKVFSALGMLAFLFGHLFYQTRIFANTQITSVMIAVICCVSTIYTCLFSIRLDCDKIESLGVNIYLIVLTLTLLLSLSNYIIVRNTTNFLLLIGLTLFFLSDSLLLKFRYDKKYSSKKIKVVYSLLYYIAQTLIALSILFI